MDPLSITLSVVSLLELTRKVANYAKETKDAPKDRTRIIHEAFSLMGLLNMLKEHVDDRKRDPRDPWLQATCALAAPDGPLHQYQLALEMLVAKVIPGHGHRKVTQALTWKFTKEDVTALLSQIERVTSFIHIALEIDHTKLTRAIRTDLREIHDDLLELKNSTNVTMDNTAVIKDHTTALQDDAAIKRKRELLDWICPTDYHEQHRDYIDRRQPDTGKWFLQDLKFQEWLQSEKSTLFCPGIPGAGKTIMAALVIDRLLRSRHEAKRPVVFIYCNYKRQSEQSIQHILSSLLRQIIDIQEEVPSVVQDLYKKRSTPSAQEIEKVLEDVSKGLLGLTVLVDALDECEANSCRRLLSIVEALRKQCKVRLLATSRDLPEIKSYTVFLGKPTLEVRAADQDLDKYVRSRIGEFRSRSRLASKPDLLETLVSSIVKAAGGMFMLALLFVESFKGKFSVEDVNTTLRNLPTGSDAYDSAYFAAMERIHAQDKDASQLATKILSWILCARRPLSTSELLHALAVKVGERNFNEDRILDTEQLITVCAGLVTIDGSSDSVRFIHYTTQEYLQRNRIKWLPHADIETARICTAYLSLDDLSTGPCYSRQEFDRRVETLALLDYAAVHWGSHMSVLAEADLASELGGEVEVEVICFLSNVKCLSSASQALFISDEDYPFAEEDIARQGAEFSGSHWIGRFGLANFFRQWDCREAQWDKRDVDGRTPLSWAAGEGHGAVSELLLETVDVNSEDTYGQTPLSWACQNAEESVAKLLLSSNKVEVDIADGSGFTPLLWAIMRGHKAIVKLLLGSDTADVEFKNEDGQTLLFIACEWGQEAVVKLLLDTGKANVNFKSRDGQTPLIMAARDRCTGEAMIKLLLDTSKVEVDWKDDYGRTALQYAATNGQEAPVKLLLDTGKVDVNSKDKKNGTPLGYATENGHGRIVKLLLDAGAVPLLPAFSPEIPAAKIAT